MNDGWILWVTPPGLGRHRVAWADLYGWVWAVAYLYMHMGNAVDVEPAKRPVQAGRGS